ncbi:hypothetical protein [Chengkuizengella axinellae]|uniref:DUF4083 domain-containing protein n=1 Tax=Chengkuizengella axinellae TaxID=3064388 RepID=A0ABT9J136_9BACL|nr:hypothetical protein [Chengkuizengella sp. 2205SS18-9]MDP5275307.1 hypothetical protein [Chengkuizengella sp. 2205SS18-9]
MNGFLVLIIILILIVICIVILERVVRTAVDTSNMAAEIKQIKGILKSMKESEQKEE